MSEIYKFPSSNTEVVILKKQDILDCIDDNILDKEVALEIINKVEEDATNYIKEGRWTGIPFMGNIRIPPHVKLEQDSETRELIKEAYETLDTSKYVLFRKELALDNIQKVKAQRLFNYQASISANKNKALYRAAAKTHGENYARVLMFSFHNLSAVVSEEMIENGYQDFTNY